jgi:hypothetical protein
MAEVVGVSRIAIDSIFIPEERRGLYPNENDALQFATGRIIKDQDPFEIITEQVKENMKNEDGRFTSL